MSIHGILKKIDNFLSFILVGIIIFGCFASFTINKENADKTFKVLKYEGNFRGAIVKDELNYFDGFKNGSVLLGKSVKTITLTTLEDVIDTFYDYFIEGHDYRPSAGEVAMNRVEAMQRHISGYEEKEKGFFSTILGFCKSAIMFILYIGLFLLKLGFDLVMGLIFTFVIFVVCAYQLLTINSPYMYHIGLCSALLLFFLIVKYSSFVDKVGKKKDIIDENQIEEPLS